VLIADYVARPDLDPRRLEVGRRDLPERVLGDPQHRPLAEPAIGRDLVDGLPVRPVVARCVDVRSRVRDERDVGHEPVLGAVIAGCRKIENTGGWNSFL